jgi:hypothetical protein
MPNIPGNEVSFAMTDQAKRVVEKMIVADAMPILRKNIRDATAPIQSAVRAEARALPSKWQITSVKGGSLRAAVAMSIKRIINLSTRSILVAITNSPSGGKSNLARVLEGTIPWEHPTFGHDPKVTQPPHPFFWRTIDKFAPAIEAKVQAVLTEFEREL